MKRKAGEAHGNEENDAERNKEQSRARFSLGLYFSGRRFSCLAGRPLGGDVEREKIASPRDHLHHLPPCVAEGDADFADALKEAVLAHMDAGPDRLHQFLFAEYTMAVLCQQLEQLEGLVAQARHRSIGAPQFGAVYVQNEIRKKVHGSPQPGLKTERSIVSAQQGRQPNAETLSARQRRIFRKISEKFSARPPGLQDASRSSRLSIRVGAAEGDGC